MKPAVTGKIAACFIYLELYKMQDETWRKDRARYTIPADELAATKGDRQANGINRIADLIAKYIIQHSYQRITSLTARQRRAVTNILTAIIDNRDGPITRVDLSNVYELAHIGRPHHAAAASGDVDLAPLVIAVLFEWDYLRTGAIMADIRHDAPRPLHHINAENGQEWTTAEQRTERQFREWLITPAFDRALS